MKSRSMMAVRHYPLQHVSGCGVDGAMMFESRSTMPVVYFPLQHGHRCGNDDVMMFVEAMCKVP